MAWALEHPLDALPSWRYVCHHCDNPPCCRVGHLFLGTALDNMLDAKHKGRGSPGNRSWGENSSNVKLTNEDVWAIRAPTETARTLATRFHVGIRHIQKIRKRKLWRHLEEEVDLDRLFGVTP